MQSHSWNLVVVRWRLEIYFYKFRDEPITALQTLDCDWFLSKYKKDQFLKVTDDN